MASLDMGRWDPMAAYRCGFDYEIEGKPPKSVLEAKTATIV